MTLPTEPGPRATPPFALVIVAAGASRRLGGEQRKVWLELAGRPVLFYSLRAAAKAPCTGPLVVVAPATDHAAIAAEAQRAGWQGALVLVPGGSERVHSVRAGLEALAGLGTREETVVLVHDAARPLVRPLDLRRVAEAAAAEGAAFLAHPLADSLHRAEDGRVLEPVSRQGLWIAETPQAARLSLLRAALQLPEARDGSASDEVTLLTRLGHPARVVPSETQNPKLTLPSDIPLLTALLAARTSA